MQSMFAQERDVKTKKCDSGGHYGLDPVHES